MVNRSISDSVKSFVSECPIHPEEDNVLFCFYLSTQEWEKVNSELCVFKTPSHLFLQVGQPWDDRPELLPLLAVYSVAFLVGVIVKGLFTYDDSYSSTYLVDQIMTKSGL